MALRAISISKGKSLWEGERTHALLLSHLNGPPSLGVVFHTNTCIHEFLFCVSACYTVQPNIISNCYFLLKNYFACYHWNNIAFSYFGYVPVLFNTDEEWHLTTEVMVLWLFFCSDFRSKKQVDLFLIQLFSDSLS